jgi:hypothetical protein
MSDISAEYRYALGTFIGENSESLMCGLEEATISFGGTGMVMFYEDPLLRRVSEIIDRVVEAGIYNHWVSLYLNICKILSRKIAIVHPFGEYFSFNYYHMQPAFYLLLMCWCLSALCFMVEIFSNYILSKRT